MIISIEQFAEKTGYTLKLLTWLCEKGLIPGQKDKSGWKVSEQKALKSLNDLKVVPVTASQKRKKPLSMRQH